MLLIETLHLTAELELDLHLSEGQKLKLNDANIASCLLDMEVGNFSHNNFLNRAMWWLFVG